MSGLFCNLGIFQNAHINTTMKKKNLVVVVIVILNSFFKGKKKRMREKDLAQRREN